MNDLMTMITDQIIASLESGVIPWKRPWFTPDRGAFNRITNKKYSLLNQLILKHEGEYASFNQWNSLGGHIKRGEKSEQIVFWKWPEEEKRKEKTDDENDENNKTSGDQDNDTKSKPILKFYRVFHISQVEGVEPLKKESAVKFEHEPIELAEKIFSKYIEREKITFDSGEYGEAYYSPTQDLIHVPCIGQYQNMESYYGTLFHEAIHSTGSKKRLNRVGLKAINFGSETYSKEELIAEIGAATILAYAGIYTEAEIKNSAAYIQSWINVLREDKKIITIAAGQAEKAVNYIIN